MKSAKTLLIATGLLLSASVVSAQSAQNLQFNTPSNQPAVQPAVPFDNEVLVTNGNDDGAGSFREAVTAANENANIGVIRFLPRVNLVNIDDTVEYTGSQALSIVSGPGRATIVSDDMITLFQSNGSDLAIHNVNFVGGYRGIVATLSPDATGDYNFSLSNSVVSGQGGFGVLIDDQGNILELEEDDGEFSVEIVESTIDSDATVNVNFNNVAVLDTGFSMELNEFGFTTQDEDGIRINEGGNGDLVFTANGLICNGNAGDGVEIDETGDGSAIVTVTDGTFNDNGAQPQNTDDLEDGFDIDEAGEGEIFSWLTNVTANGNNDEGVDYDEEDGGDVRLLFTGLVVNNNMDDGISVDEENGGDMRARLIDVTTLGNGDDGIDIDEDNAGVSSVSIDRVLSSGNGAAGIDVDEDGDGGTLTNRVSILEGNPDGEVTGDLTEQ